MKMHCAAVILVCFLCTGHVVGQTTTAASTSKTSVIMTVVDSPGQADQTIMDLGETARLKLLLTVTDHEDKMDIAGARVTNCLVSKNSDFSSSVTFIDTNGCFKDVDIFDNVNTNIGFNRDASSSKVGKEKTYIAFSPKFEMSSFTNNPVNADHKLYFKCDIRFCFDDSDSVTTGQCGGNHCLSAKRKKRDIPHSPEASVTASVNVTANGNKRNCDKCTETKGFQVTVGGLATAAAILFGLMTVSFTAAKSTAVARSQGRKMTCKKDSVPPPSQSVKGSDVINTGNSVQKQ